VPASGRFAGVYVQGISAYAPHPNAAKLWEEFLYSDEGQNIWLKGYCHPIRYEDLTANNKVPQDQLDKLPDVTGAVFPALAQLTAATELITTQWDTVVGVDVAE
jgi:putative spermidine/putrescine transport system substrate-binding protein